MSDKTSIEWSDATWNVVTGCTRVSEGCRNCYIDTTPPFRIAGREFRKPHGSPGTGEPGETTGVILHPDRLDKPLHWRKPRRVFVNSLSDLFHDAIPDEFIAQVFAVMALTPQHTYQVLTKRPGRMRSLLARPEFLEEVKRRVDGWPAHGSGRRIGRWDREFGWPLSNCWLGVSVEDQKTADLRIPILLETPAAVRWISAEPLLGPIDLERIRQPGADPRDALRGSFRDDRDLLYEQGLHPRLDWVVAGGESKKGARPSHPDWFRSLRDQCQAAGVPFFFKQWGEWGGDRSIFPELPSGLRAQAIRTLSEGPLDMVWVRRSNYTPRRFPPHLAGEWAYAKSRSRPAVQPVLWHFGKKRAGRLLDGRTWDEFPKAVGS